MKKGTSHKNQLDRVRRIEGQVRGVAKMIEEQRYCVDIVTQVKAISSALKSLEGQIIDQHMRHCVHQAVSSDDPQKREESYHEILRLFKSSGP